MSSDPYRNAIMQIERAELATTIYRTARRLLDCVDPKFGHIRLSKAEIKSVVGSEAYNTARSHLIQLQRSGVIHYSVNGDVYVNFSSWGRSLSDHGGSLSDHGRSLSDQCKDSSKEGRALSDHGGSLSDHYQLVIGWLVLIPMILH